jgi:hypothetical protein
VVTANSERMPPLSSWIRRKPRGQSGHASSGRGSISPTPEPTSAGVKTPFCGRQVTGTGRNWDRTPRIRHEDDAQDVASISGPGLEAQIGSVRFTMVGGPHAGSYRFDTGQCDVLGGRGTPRSIISMFPTEMQKGGRADPRSPTSFALYTEPGKGKPDGLALVVEFRSGASRERTR